MGVPYQPGDLLDSETTCRYIVKFSGVVDRAKLGQYGRLAGAARYVSSCCLPVRFTSAATRSVMSSPPRMVGGDLATVWSTWIEERVVAGLFQEQHDGFAEGLRPSRSRVGAG